LEAGMEVIVGRGHGAAAAAGAAGMVLARAAGLRHGGIARWSWGVVIDAEDAAHLLLEESRFLNDLLTHRAPDVARVLHDCGDQLEPLLHHRVHERGDGRDLRHSWRRSYGNNRQGRSRGESTILQRFHVWPHRRLEAASLRLLKARSEKGPKHQVPTKHGALSVVNWSSASSAHCQRDRRCHSLPLAQLE